MKLAKFSALSLAVLAGISLVTPAFAVVNIDYVNIGNPGNGNDPTTGYGSVAYAYKIAKNETTVSIRGILECGGEDRHLRTLQHQHGHGWQCGGHQPQRQLWQLHLLGVDRC